MYKRNLLAEYGKARSKHSRAHKAREAAIMKGYSEINVQTFEQMIAEKQAVNDRVEQESPHAEIEKIWKQGSMLKTMLDVMGQGKQKSS